MKTLISRLLFGLFAVSSLASCYMFTHDISRKPRIKPFLNNEATTLTRMYLYEILPGDERYDGRITHDLSSTEYSDYTRRLVAKIPPGTPVRFTHGYIRNYAGWLEGVLKYEGKEYLVYRDIGFSSSPLGTWEDTHQDFRFTSDVKR